MDKLKKFRVDYEITGTAYRIVEAFDENDAIEQVEGNIPHSDDCEEAAWEPIEVHHAMEVKPEKKAKKK